MIKKVKWFIKVLLGKEIIVFRDKKINSKWYGNTYAGFYVYDEVLNNNSIVYSFGIGEDISFDEELINKFDCKVFGFDPTPKSICFIKNKKMSKKYSLQPYGLYNFDGNVEFLLPEDDDNVSCTIGNIRDYQSDKINKVSVPVLKFESIISKIGSNKIDLLKLDIEGSEYDVIDEILNSNIKIDQICIEFHHRFSGISKKMTKSAIKKLRIKGYKLIAISNQAEEFTFAHESII